MRKRILVINPSLVPNGGGSGVCAWILEALKDEHDVALLAFRRPDFEAVNRYYGTGLLASEVEVHAALPWLPPLALEAPILRRYRLWHLLARGRRMPGFDLRVSAEEESDLGDHGIQYLHFPCVGRDAGNRSPRALAARAYQALITRATGTSIERMRRNITVVNSDWTGRLVSRLHGIGTITIHPPAAGAAPEVPWNRRASAFVCVGRFQPDKRFELAIEILGAVRARGHAVRLAIVGSHKNAEYRAHVLALVRAHADWVTVHEDLSRDELMRLFAGHRYGIHAKEDEHYGMAVAEAVRAGAIVFVPRGGGQVEIVDNDDRLVWSTRDEAVAKIARVLEDPGLQESLRQRLALRREHLGADRFVREVRALVRRAVAPAQTSAGA